jgi:hypothetical protein
MKQNPELIRRVQRLQFLAVAFGFQNSLVERAAYRVLETDCSRPRAIARYIRFWLFEFWFQRLLPTLVQGRRYYWYRYFRFWSPDRINAKLEQEMMRDLERKYGPDFKAGLEKSEKEDGCEL